MNLETANSLRIASAKSFLASCINTQASAFHANKQVENKCSWKDQLESVELLSRFDIKNLPSFLPRIFTHEDVSYFIAEQNISQTHCNALAAIILIRQKDKNGLRLCKCLRRSISGKLFSYYSPGSDIEGQPPPATPAVYGRVILALLTGHKEAQNEDYLNLAAALGKSLSKSEPIVFDHWTAIGLEQLSNQCPDQQFLNFLKKGIDKYRGIRTIALPANVAGQFLQAYIAFWQLCKKFGVVVAWLDAKIYEVFNHLCSLQVTKDNTQDWNVDQFEGAFVKNVIQPNEIRLNYVTNGLSALLAYKEFLNVNSNDTVV